MTTGGKLNLKKPNLNDDWLETIGTDLPANFQKIDDEFSAHLAETVTQETVHGLRYEEGSWTPIIYGYDTAGSHTYTNQIGKYIRVNNKVTCYGYITLSAKDENMAGNVKIGGLPFTIANPKGSISFGFIKDFNFNAEELCMQGYVVSNRIDWSLVKNNAPPANVQPIAIQDTTSLMFTIEYYID